MKKGWVDKKKNFLLFFKKFTWKEFINILQKENEIYEKINEIQNSKKFCGKNLVKEPIRKNIEKPINKLPTIINEIKIGEETYLLTFLENLKVNL